jgi:threonine dehydrogenase-like Zn-dependent dehydrogenase
MRVEASSMCYSTYKALKLGAEHKRVPDNIAEHPVMTGHEFTGTIAEVGADLKDRYQVGERIVIQPAMGLPSGYSPGYSYQTYGGDATYTIVPDFAIERGAILPYESDYFANGCLAEPMMCIIGAFHANFHTTQYVYEHQMGIKPEGNLALLGAAGPMGLGAIEYALNGPYSPRTVVVTDINQDRLDRACKLLPPSLLEGTGRKLVYLNTAGVENPTDLLRLQTGGAGFDDIFVFAANDKLIELADAIKAPDCCLNLFAGPTDEEFSARFNFYDVHYESSHVVGTSGGSRSDMEEGLDMVSEGKLNPSLMITHIGGLDAVPSALKAFPTIGGGKKLFYTSVRMPLIAISELRNRVAEDPRFTGLADICEANKNVWNRDAERYLLKHWGTEGPAVGNTHELAVSTLSES